MIYNLIKKEATNDYLKARELIIKSSTLDENRIQDEYSKAFPYDYDPKENFVVKGDLIEPFIIEEDFTIKFLTDREQIKKNIKSLQEGEILEGDNIVSKPQPSQYHTWNGMEWVFSKKDEIKKDLTIKLAEYRHKVQEKYTYLGKHTQRWSVYDQIRMSELKKDFEEGRVLDIYGTEEVVWVFEGVELEDFIIIKSVEDIDEILKAGKRHEMNCRKAQFSVKQKINQWSGKFLLDFDIESKFDNQYNLLAK